MPENPIQSPNANPITPPGVPYVPETPLEYTQDNPIEFGEVVGLGEAAAFSAKLWNNVLGKGAEWAGKYYIAQKKLDYAREEAIQGEQELIREIGATDEQIKTAENKGRGRGKGTSPEDDETLERLLLKKARAIRIILSIFKRSLWNIRNTRRSYWICVW